MSRKLIPYVLLPSRHPQKRILSPSSTSSKRRRVSGTHDSSSGPSCYVEVPTLKSISRRWKATRGSNAHESADARVSTPSTSEGAHNAANTEDDDAVSVLLDEDITIDNTYPSNTTTSSPEPQAPVDIFYFVQDHEIPEAADLSVTGEVQNSDDISITDSEVDDIPVRRLSDWVVYRSDTRAMVPFIDICRLGDDDASDALGVILASGNVRPERCDGSDSDSDSSDGDDEDNSVLDSCSDQRVALSPLVDFNVYSHQDGMLDNKIWIRTEHAWYILDRPSDDYLSFFQPFHIAHRMVHSILSLALENPRITYENFMDSLHTIPPCDEDTMPVHEMLGRHLQEEDLNNATVEYCHTALQLVRRDSGIKLERVPLIRHLMDIRQSCSASVSQCPASSPLRLTSTLRCRPPAFRQPSNPERDVLLHRSDTIVTPTVRRIASGLFHSPLRLAGDPEEPITPATLPYVIQTIHHGNPKCVVWGTRSSQNRYDSVTMDGALYRLGDFVIVEPGDDSDKTRAQFAMKACTQSSNPLANHWFAKISYLFENKGVKSFHAEWFVHGSKTILQELAHPRGLFPYGSRDSCQDLPLSCIYQKCNLHYLPPTTPEPLPDPAGPPNNFFYSDLTYSEDDVSFMVHSESTIAKALDCCEKGGYPPCLSCGLDLLQDCENELHIYSDQFSYLGSTYHTHDFAYLQAFPDPDGPYQIAQILGFSHSRRAQDFKILVCFLARYDDIVRREQRSGLGLGTLGVKDERRLYITLDTSTVPYTRIAGKCYVQHSKSISDIDQWLSQYDHFHLEDKARLLKVKTSCDVEILHPSEFELCHECLGRQQSSLQKQCTMSSQVCPLQGLELFAGAGGLSTGFDLSGHVDTRWLVEFSPACAMTLKHNKQDATVYNQDCNVLLEHAILASQGDSPAPLKSSDGRKSLPPLPKPGEVDFIYGGVPCQSFSKANRHKRPDDKRTALSCNMMSYIEHYRPDFTGLENVTGFLHHPLGNKDGQYPEGGVEMGMVKFVLRSHIALGYQIHFNVLQAGQYGAPQGRQRVIFWGARIGIPLPKFPVPTHYFKHPWHAKLSNGKKTWSVSRSKDANVWAPGAPLYSVTVEDAIGDLPAFDWINPHITLPRTSANKEEALERKASGIPAFDALSRRGISFPGFHSPVEYGSVPRTRYQSRMRQRSGDKVTGHYTARFSDLVVERTVNVPLEPDASWLDLPEALALHKSGKPVADGIYQRINGQGFFRTSVTTVNPASKGSTVLHPSQKRILTVRECARAQGFPDHWEFLSSNTKPNTIVQDQLRQIGNAVPVPLALALGRSLGDSLMERWEAHEREGSSEL